VAAGDVKEFTPVAVCGFFCRIAAPRLSLLTPGLDEAYSVTE